MTTTTTGTGTGDAPVQATTPGTPRQRGAALATFTSTLHAERRADRDADADRRLRVAEAEQGLRQAARAAKLAEAAERRELRRDEAAEARADREARRSERTKRRDERRAAAREVAPALVSGLVYSMAVGTAAAGQVSVARSLGWSVFAGAGVAVFIEGLALAMALTAREQRLEGEHAVPARVLTWAAAAFASAVNAYAHRAQPVAALLFGAASLAGITLWEIRSERRTRGRLRELGMVPEPGPRLGFAFCARFPGLAWAARSAFVADPSLRTRDEVLAAGHARRALGWMPPVDAVRYAVTAAGTRDRIALQVWLLAQGVRVEAGVVEQALEPSSALDVVLASAEALAAQDVALALYGDAGRDAVERARRELNTLAESGQLARDGASTGGRGKTVRYRAVAALEPARGE